jgi:hypothetical protein
LLLAISADRGLSSNYSFKPNPLRGCKDLGVPSRRVGLIQVLGLMHISRQLAALLATTLLSLPASAAQYAHVDIEELAKHAAQFVGKSLSTHACLAMSPHGSFIEPCGSKDWHELVLIVDPLNKLPDVYGSIDFSHDIEGDFSGVMIQRSVDLPKPGKRYFLQLDAVANSTVYEP